MSTTSSPGSMSPSRAAAIASVAPNVTCTPVSGSTSIPYQRDWWAAIASRSTGTPASGEYWLCPARIAACAASSSSAGPSSSGNPWPRLTAPVRSASADISVKIVVPKEAIRVAVTRRRLLAARIRERRGSAVELRGGLHIGRRRHARELRGRRLVGIQRRRAARVERVLGHQRARLAVAVTQAEHVAELVCRDPHRQRPRPLTEIRRQQHVAGTVRGPPDAGGEAEAVAAAELAQPAVVDPHDDAGRAR